VIPRWRALLDGGARVVPVTDPDATRFWMTIDEAVSLVLDTLHTMQGGELVIPQSLPAYRLGDLAKAMAADMEVIGLPTFEKQHESMREGLTSEAAPRLSIDDIRQRIARL
jgi:UDP-N-acetylglucosamine 4,6-dehydratase